MLNDGGWGGLVRKGLEAGEFADALVEAAAELVGKRWRPDPPPTWVTCVPSTSRPEVVAGFAERLAAALGLPFRPVVVKTRETKPQLELENSQQQFSNVWGAFAVDGSVPPGEPVLLVDDLVDSRWTLTVVGAALLEAGSGPVSPVRPREVRQRLTAGPLAGRWQSRLSIVRVSVIWGTSPSETRRPGEVAGEHRRAASDDPCGADRGASGGTGRGTGPRGSTRSGRACPSARAPIGGRPVTSIIGTWAQAPDLIEPIVGFRAWRYTTNERRVQLFPFNLTPEDFFEKNVWDGAWTGWVTASCPGTDERGHVAPDENCSCGFYAMKSDDDLTSFAEAILIQSHPPEDEGFDGAVFGRVHLAGKVIEHELGYRAERARIAELIPTTTDRGITVSLASRLGLPTGAAWDTAPTLAEFEQAADPTGGSATVVRRSPIDRWRLKTHRRHFRLLQGGGGG